MNSTKNNTTFPQVVEIPAPLEIYPSVSPLAAELLMKVAERLHHTPERYNQMWPIHECDTPCCIIGHMEGIAGCRDIGLIGEQHRRLFHASQWPRALMERINPGYVPGSGSAKFPASFGIARIEHFLRTGE